MGSLLRVVFDKVCILYVTSVSDDRVLLKCQWLGVGLLVLAETVIGVSEMMRSSCIVNNV